MIQLSVIVQHNYVYYIVTSSMVVRVTWVQFRFELLCDDQIQSGGNIALHTTCVCKVNVRPVGCFNVVERVSQPNSRARDKDIWRNACSLEDCMV